MKRLFKKHRNPRFRFVELAKKIIKGPKFQELCCPKKDRNVN